jgi:hypothetical protein
MNNQPVYIKFNSYRKSEFAISTQIKQEKDKYKVFKLALNDKGTQFLKRIKDHHTLLTKSNLPLKIHSVNLVNDYLLEIEYIRGGTLLNELLDSAEKNAKKDCLKIFDSFSELLNEFPSKNDYLSEDFKKIFGKTEEKKKYKLIKPGILDLNFDNIIKTKDKELTLIDFEWTFDFGIPKRYLFYRAIYSSYMKLQKPLFNTLSIKEVESLFNFSEEEIELYLFWEVNFQKSVSGIPYKPKDLLENKRAVLDNPNYTHPVLINKKELEHIKLQLEQIKTQKELAEERSKELERQFAELHASHTALKKSNESLKVKADEFDGFKKGTIWKILTLWRNMKNKIKKIIRK